MANSFWLPDGMTDDRAVEVWNHIRDFSRKECGPKSGIVVPAWLFLWADEKWDKLGQKFDNVMSTMNVDYEDMLPEGDEE